MFARQAALEAGYSIGVIKFYSEERGYGFIIPEQGGADIFFHAKVLEPAGFALPVAGELLGYKDIRYRGRRRASAVCKIEG